MSGLQRIAEHVYWLPPAKPDRPSLCAVVGEHATLMLDAGASDAHARLFLDALAAEGVAPPTAVVLTHSDWDHVFGAAEVGAPVLAHRLTDDRLAEHAATDWSDEALDARVAAGAKSPEHAANVKAELPAPRTVRVARADTVFDDGLELELGGVTVQVRHVGGDHAADSTVMYVREDRLLFLGDALYESTGGEAGGAARTLTVERAFPLLDAVLAFDAELYVEGHTDTVMPREEAVDLLDQFRWAGTLVANGSLGDEESALAAARDALGDEPTELQTDLIRAFIAGRNSENELSIGTVRSALEKVSESVHHLPEIHGGPTILTGATVTIVDTGVPGSESAILAAVEELGRSRTEITDIVITHADGDHVGSLAALVEATQATVWAGAHEANVIEGQAPGRNGDVKQSGSVDRRFEPGETLPLHGGIETVATHGHTAGHVALFLPDDRILIAGDALNNRAGLGGSTPEYTADPAQARESVGALAALRPESIVFGHGPSIIGGAAQHLEELDKTLA